MRVLFISRDLSGGDLCHRLQQEGNDVKLFIYEKRQRKNLEGIVKKTDNWRKELGWVGKEGLIVFDSTGYGRIQDRLRRKGYSVVGGCELGDRMEDDREFGEHILSQYGVQTLPAKSFTSIDDAISFVEKERGQWVVKQDGHVSKTYNYVGQMDDGNDVIEMLKLYRENNKHDSRHIELQQRVYGIEIGVARYFNGNDWIGPIEMNVEHKSLCVGGLGPKTDEMGTLMWYDDNEEKNVLFRETLAKLKPYLQQIGFHGDIDINCIVNEEGIHPLEVTARFGSPAMQLQSALHISPWGEFLKAVADGETYDLKYKKKFGIIVLLAVPPFPYAVISKQHSSHGSEIFFREQLSLEEQEHIHLEEISKNMCGNFFISGDQGFVLDVSGVGDTVEEAQLYAYKLAEKIVIPKKFYRTDIGLKFMEQEAALLKKWGYLPKEFSC